MHIKFYLSTPEGMTLITEHNFGIRFDFETILKSIVGSLQSIFWLKPKHLHFMYIAI